MAVQLYDWQEHDVARIREAGYRALVAAEPGAGKSILSVAVVLDAVSTGFIPENPQVLVIAPQSTHLSAWGKTMNVFDLDPIRVVGNGNKAQKAAMADLEWGVPGWYAVTPQLFTRNDVFKTVTPDVVIADESHTLSRPGTAGQKRMGGYTVREYPKSLAARSTVRLALSGTPARNKFELLWGAMRFLWPELDDVGEVAQTPFSAWQRSRMDSVFSPFATTGREYTEEATPGLLMLEAPCVVQHYRRRRCCEFHPNGFMPLDEPVVVNETLTLTAKQKKVLKELEEKAVAWLEDNPLKAALPIVKQIRIRQAVLGELSVEDYFDNDGVAKQRVWFEDNAKSPFADRVEEILDELGDEPVLVLTSSKLFAKYLTQRLVKRGDDARELSGDTRKTRDADVAEFGDTYRVAVAVIDAIGTGTDGLGKRCNTEIWVDVSMDRALNNQAASRLDRIGQSRRVHRTMLADDTGYAVRRWTKQEQQQEALDKSVVLGVE